MLPVNFRLLHVTTNDGSLIFRTNLHCSKKVKYKSTIQANNIQKLIDLRKKSENDEYSIQLDHNVNISTYDIFENIENKTYSIEQKKEQYTKILYNRRNEISKCIHEILDSNTNILIGCQFGKDRTGIICMLLQMKSGRSKSEIVDEYIKSQYFIQSNIDHFEKYRVKRTMSHNEFKISLLMHSEVIEHSMQFIKDIYNGIEGYVL